MKGLTTITTEAMLSGLGAKSDGYFDFGKSRDSFVYDGKTYTYHSSGLSRCVYKSDCGKFVIKVPYDDRMNTEEIKMHLEKDLRYAMPSITHNYGEAKAYEECPEEFKKYLAKTELLPNCWVKQEFVEVLKCEFTGRHDLREIGRREDGSICIFDYDPLLHDFVFTRFSWERLPKMISDIEEKL